MHGRDLNVTYAAATLASGALVGAATSTRAAHGSTKPDELVLAFSTPLPAGTHQLEIRYDAPFAANLGGLYRVKEGERWYAFTQFESVDARRAFPCFDEPAFKTAYDISINVPSGMIAVSNAPESSRADNDFQFQTTRPLPSYLVAFAVGDFDVREGAQTPIPIRLITAKGKSAMGSLALDATRALVAKLGDYFGIRYPYEKLDIVAVPDFAAGAMENPGLITFREELLLLDEARAPTAAKRGQAATIAHELAHQWFGDLVTMQWWDDTWLNEGFATWAEEKIVDQWQPSFGGRLEAIDGIQWVMDVDALHSARAVRQPVTSVSEAEEAFDGITYDKGAAVLHMIEEWIGEDTFRKGVQDYLHANAWRNARAADLLKALDLASNKDVTKMAATFLDQTGVPNVGAQFTCNAKGTLTMSLKQAPWVPLGAAAPSSRSWSLPLCAVTDSKAEICTTLDAAPIALETTAPCAAWVYPNAGENGYFRFTLDDASFRTLAKNAQHLDVPNRIGLLSNLWAEVRSGAVAPKLLLDTLPLFDSESNRYVVDKVIEILRGMNFPLIEDAARPAFRAYVSARLQARKRALGWEAVKGEAEDQALLRRSVLGALADLADDDATLREADKYAQAWLSDPSSVSGDLAQLAVGIASRRAGPARVDALRAAAKIAKTPHDRSVALRALGGFNDPDVLRKALDVTLTDDVKLSELERIYWDGLRRRAARPIVLAWVRSHWDALRTKLPEQRSGGLADLLDATCLQADRDDWSHFLSEKLADVDGHKRRLDQAFENASLCAALHDQASQATTAALTTPSR